MSKAIGIARQSKGDDASKSIEAQVARIRDYSKSEGFNPRASGSLALVDILNDPALSDEERAEAKAAHERYVRAGLELHDRGEHPQGAPSALPR